MHMIVISAVVAVLVRVLCNLCQNFIECWQLKFQSKKSANVYVNLNRRRSIATSSEELLSDTAVRTGFSKSTLEKTRYRLQQLEYSSKRYASVLEKIISLLFLFLLLGLIQQGGSVGDSQVQDALKDAVEPRMTEHTLEQICTWIEYQVQTIWTPTICADGVCTVPFEFPSYGRYEKDQYFGHGAQTPKAITTIDVPKQSTESTWYVRLRGDYYGIVSGAVYDSADPTALVPIPLEPPFEWS
ncbi:hypothetical protein CYMTET_8907 [Cymbomonas tetramitiformis]|uniref:Uncharacterized protein n=1 Tax=Cymbomonas tetramitiformis TaxID=36881 RepID=A0AAE0GSQ9_9CHLO|nr:hypothetical protein CYMTET_8907 [Cymbomonas tetramitiformis]